MQKAEYTIQSIEKNLKILQAQIKAQNKKLTKQEIRMKRHDWLYSNICYQLEHLTSHYNREITRLQPIYSQRQAP